MAREDAASVEDSGLRGLNPGVPFELDLVRRFRVPESELEKRAQDLARSELPRGSQALAPLLKILGSIDLTTLSGDDSVSRIRRLCRLASSPLPSPLVKSLDKEEGPRKVAAVCVYPAFVSEALEALKGSGIPVATVSAGFPHGLSTLPVRIREVDAAREAGAQEIDVVIRREWPLSGNWTSLFQEVRAFREAAGSAHLKVILGTGELDTLNRVGRAALTSLMAGADFVKTSTGKEKVNATLPVGLAMTRAMARYEALTGVSTGIKPAGGIKTATEAYRWLVMVGEELGEHATTPHRFRIGASSLLGDVVEALEVAVVTGR